jgi:large subunit ribosomal protein L21
MYAVIETGGTQYRVRVGDVIRTHRVAGDPGAPVVFDRVLLLAGDDRVQVGSPTVEGAAVRGSIVSHGRGKKIRIYLFKRRQNSNRRRMGHRQDYTAVKIDSIEA